VQGKSLSTRWTLRSTFLRRGGTDSIVRSMIERSGARLAITIWLLLALVRTEAKLRASASVRTVVGVVGTELRFTLRRRRRCVLLAPTCARADRRVLGRNRLRSRQEVNGSIECSGIPSDIVSPEDHPRVRTLRKIAENQDSPDGERAVSRARARAPCDSDDMERAAE
jgi:hypothetical protein